MILSSLSSSSLEMVRGVLMSTIDEAQDDAASTSIIEEEWAEDWVPEALVPAWADWVSAKSK